jgi:WD40 repeat protein
MPGTPIMLLSVSDSDPNASVNPLKIIQPIHKFEAHPDSTLITALVWSPHTFITGSARGTTHVFDALSFRHLRSFASPIPKTSGRYQGDEAAEAAERDSQKVKQIVVGTGSGSAGLNVTSGGDNGSSLIEDNR